MAEFVSSKLPPVVATQSHGASIETEGGYVSFMSCTHFGAYQAATVWGSALFSENGSGSTYPLPAGDSYLHIKACPEISKQDSDFINFTVDEHLAGASPLL